MTDLRAELAELIAIPSVSADPAHRGDMARAAAWVAERIAGAGGEVEVVPGDAHPVVVGELRASSGADAAPTILCYGHYDVQPPGERADWETDPFVLTEVDDWLCARGVADDKGPLFMLLAAAARLRKAGELPVNLRFLCDGEEEISGVAPVELLRRDPTHLDGAIVFDTGWPDAERPAFTVATRGLAYLRVVVTTGAGDLHSGLYGGAALNAFNVLTSMLASLFDQSGRPIERLRSATVVPRVESDAWGELMSGGAQLAAVGARPADPAAARRFYDRVWAEASVDVHGIEGGSPALMKSVIPARAAANLSARVVPGQSAEGVVAALTELLEGAAPAEAEVRVEALAASQPVLVDVASPLIALAAEAFTEVLGRTPAMLRSGVSIPVLEAIAERGAPALLTGFALPESNLHAPNERILAAHLDLGVDAAEAVFRRLGRMCA